MSKGLLIVVSAPSGCGKGTILAEILKNDNFYCSVSATTRNPREGEVDGVNYHFLSKEQFEKLIADAEMLEYVGLGIAMGNALDKVKKASNYITTHIDDDGIYNALKHFNII